MSTDVRTTDEHRMRLPRPDRIPDAGNERTVPEIDTGGAFRPDWRKQNPSSDPTEPYGSESGSTGEDHGWSNCTMTAAALAYAYATGDQSGPWGGDMRHHQDDLSGGTDLYDADTAFNRLGQNLDVLIGSGWSVLKSKRAEGRAVIVQGEGNVPGSESFDGGHACCIGLETASDGKWLWGDPLASGWQWVTESSIRDWCENLSSGIYFAVTKVAPVPPPTTPPPSEDETVRTFFVPLEPMLATVKTGAWLYTNSALDSDPGNIQVSPGRDMPYVGKTADSYIVAYVNSSGARSDDSYWVKLADVSGTKPDPTCGDDEPCPECPDPADAISEAVAARDQEWVDSLTEVWPAGAVSLLAEGS
jgi:hypothetical protein